MGIFVDVGFLVGHHTQNHNKRKNFLFCFQFCCCCCYKYYYCKRITIASTRIYLWYPIDFLRGILPSRKLWIRFQFLGGNRFFCHFLCGIDFQFKMKSLIVNFYCYKIMLILLINEFMLLISGITLFDHILTLCYNIGHYF